MVVAGLARLALVAGAVFLGTVQSQADATFHDVRDQGELWFFVFLHAGEEVELLALRQRQLTERGWWIAIPMTVEEHLRAVRTVS